MATKPEKSAGNAKRTDSKKKKPAFSAQEAREQKKQAKRKGLRPGARNSVEAQEQKGQSAKDKDARVGSRKPIALVAEAPVTAAKAPRPVAPKPEPVVTQEQQLAKWERELDKLENDDRLNTLLDKLELEQAVSAEDQEWLDKKLARHQELLKLLGLNEEEKAASDPDELLQRFIETDFDPKEFDSRYKED
nr:Der GTPase-activating protein YihI [uncultured Tolumonas sp.]